MCMGGGGGADKNVGKAAMETAKLSREQLEWFKQEYAATADDRAAAVTRANAIGDTQLQTMQQQNAQAAELAAFDKATFRPIQQRLATEAMNYDTPERRQAAAAEATADVRMAADRQRGTLSRDLSRAGVAPGSGASMALMQQGGLQTAANEAGAANMARRNVENMGYARMSDAANGGRSVTAQQQAATATALSAGSAAVGSSQAALGSSMSGMGVGNSAYGTSASMMGQAGSLYGQNAQAEAQKSASNQQAWGTAGALAGAALIAFSDEKGKKNIKPTSGPEMLDAVESTPVSAWDYREGKGDGGRHIGPMAQDVRRTMGEQAAPGGKAIDLVTMNGVAMGAIKEVAKRVAKIEKKVNA